MSAIASISEVKSGEVHGPSFAVYAAVGGDQNMVTRTKAALTFALDAKSCRTAEEQHPFVMHVTMWLIRRRRVAETIRCHVLLHKYFDENFVGCDAGCHRKD
jgi:hypothetical protein